jgi:fermentation-respiration switch protein FrsA (DUF1100 family)
MLAGNARPLEELLHEQIEYTGGTEADENRILAMMPDAYRKDLAAYDQLAAAKRLTIPLLILQGERDYQVTMKDFAMWQAALKDHKNVTLKSYANLNHLFGEGEGPSKPTEYLTPTPIPGYVLDDIAAWIKRH